MPVLPAWYNIQTCNTSLPNTGCVGWGAREEDGELEDR